MKIIIFIAFLTISSSINENINHRVKRKVLFTKNSKLFFRLNGKENVIPWTQIFAHGWAFRVNWELPETLPKRHKFFKREIKSNLENLTKIPGYSCIMRHLCDFLKNVQKSSKCGVFCEIGKIFSRSESVDKLFFQTLFANCASHVENCSHLSKDNFYSLKDEKN